MLKILGTEARLIQGRRDSLESPVPDCWLVWGNTRINLDDPYLPSRLARLIPVGYGHASGKQWEPFVTLAVAMGKL